MPDIFERIFYRTKHCENLNYIWIIYDTQNNLQYKNGCL